MPAFATHEIFGEEGLEGMASVELLQAVVRHRNVFRAGCQGPDVFLFNPFMLNSRKELNLGSRMHEEGVNRFFRIYLDELLAEKTRFGLETAVSYLLGFLAHYSLDSELHPYIYSRIGFRRGRPENGDKRTGFHQRLEAVMDKKILMSKREMMPSAYHPEKMAKLSGQELQVIADIMASALSRTYHIQVRPENFRASYWCMQRVMSQVYDHSGKKRRIVCRLEDRILKNAYMSNLMVSDHLEDAWDVMNLTGQAWEHPWRPGQYFHCSVWELYDNALERYSKYTEALEHVLSGMFQRMTLLEKRRSRAENVKNALEELIPGAAKALENRSYHSGLSLEPD